MRTLDPATTTTYYVDYVYVSDAKYSTKKEEIFDFAWILSVCSRCDEAAARCILAFEC